MTADQSQAPAEAHGTSRKDFEAWTVSFYGGLANAADTWDEQRQTYTEYAHHMAWCLWRSLAPRSNVQPKGTAAAVAEERKLIGELHDALDRIVSYYKNPRQTITLWDQAKSDHEHTMFGAAIAILDRTKGFLDE